MSTLTLSSWPPFVTEQPRPVLEITHSWPVNDGELYVGDPVTPTVGFEITVGPCVHVEWEMSLEEARAISDRLRLAIAYASGAMARPKSVAARG